jgi:hypothetical protein
MKHKSSHSSSADAIKAGVGRNRGSSTSASSPSAFALLSSSRSLRSRSSHSDASLCTSSSTGPGTSLPMSVVDRKSSTALLHLSSASRSRTFQRLFHLPVSFLTSAHYIFCCSVHAGHTLKQCSRVCIRYRHLSTERWDQTPQQFELGTNQVLNQTNQLLGDCKPDQLLNQTNCQALNWENCVNCQFCGCGVGFRVWLLANNPPYTLILYTTSSSLMMYCLRLPPSSHNPIPCRPQ